MAETWLLNSSIGSINSVDVNITFTSNNTSFSRFHFLGSHESSYYYLYYDTTLAYDTDDYGTYTNQAYRTITFDTAPTGDLLTWLQANGTKQSNKLSVDLTTLSGWSNLSSGSHTIKLVAKGSGYRDSEKSEGVSVTKAAETVTLSAGTYKFVDSPGGFTSTNDHYQADINFTSKPYDNGNTYIDIDAYYSDGPDYWTMYYHVTEISPAIAYNSSTGWEDEEYKTITLSTDQQVSQEFYTWFTANTNKVYTLEAGTYKWKDSVDVPDTVGETYSFSFTCNNVDYNSMETTGGLSAGGLWYDTAHVVSVGDDAKWSNWINDAYKTITLTTSQTVSAEFYDWAITQGNLVKQIPSVTFAEDNNFMVANTAGASPSANQAYVAFNETSGTFIEKLTAATSSDTVTALLTTSGYTEAEANVKLAVSTIGDTSARDGNFACTSSATNVWVLIYSNGSWIVKTTTKSGTTFSGNTGLSGTVPIIVIVE